MITHLSLRNFLNVANRHTRRLLHNYCLDPTIGLTAEQIKMQSTARDFACSELYTHMVEWNKNEIAPRPVLEKAGELGFGAIYCSKEFGGGGKPRVDATIIYEQLAAGCTSTAVFMSVHNMCAWILDTFGSVELRKRYMPGISSFKVLSSFCLAEPDRDVNVEEMSTIAKREGDFYIVNGKKLSVIGCVDADLYIVILNREEQSKPNSVICLAIDQNTPGISLVQDSKPVQWKSHPMVKIVTFNDCKVPVTNEVGGYDKGMFLANAGINGGRLNIASCALGATQMSVDLVIEYLKTHKEQGKVLSEFDYYQYSLADMCARLLPSRFFIREAADHLQKKTEHATSMCAAAKLHATTSCFQVLNEILEIYRDGGFLKGFPMKQYLEDCMAHENVVGSNKIMRSVLSKDLLMGKTFH